ncbi:hypothetical protein RB213_002753, partial [Colletotrichum asianum]
MGRLSLMRDISQMEEERRRANANGEMRTTMQLEQGFGSVTTVKRGAAASHRWDFGAARAHLETGRDRGRKHGMGESRDEADRIP